MPHLKLTAPPLSVEQKRRIARELTEATGRALDLPGHELAWTTVRFAPLALEDLAVGGTLACDTLDPAYELEFAEPGLSREQKILVVRTLTPLLARLFGIGPEKFHKIAIRFTTYELADQAVGGRFVSERERGWAGSV